MKKHLILFSVFLTLPLIFFLSCSIEIHDEHSNPCDPESPYYSPYAIEVTCDGIDNDCNAATLDAPDGDNDTWDVCGVGDPVNPDGNSPADCNDGDDSIYPGAPEICGDGIDQDCDESLICDGGTVDSDEDEYSSIASGGIDCDDSDDSIYPSAPEICDGIDNQCPGDAGYEIIDEGCIPVGCFDMGDSSDSCLYGADECPVHNVCISAFKMDVHEVTNAEYRACVDAGVCSAPSTSCSWTRGSYYGNPTYDDYPVIHVSWNDATTYCDWAGKRLPTEAEWEYAARGGLAGKRYPWGDSITCADACYGRLDSSEDCWNYGGLDNDTHPVGSYAPNGYNLFDMVGNVNEWVNDWYSDSYYQYCVDNTIVSDPSGPDAGSERVLRGGSWYGGSFGLRTGNRIGYVPSTWTNTFGFRCASSGD